MAARVRDLCGPRASRASAEVGRDSIRASYGLVSALGGSADGSEPNPIFSACTGDKSDGCAYVGEQFGWEAVGPHGPRLGYGLVRPVMRRGGLFDYEAFDRLYYGTSGLFYKFSLSNSGSHDAVRV